MIYIGIDPAFRANGFWACFINGSKVEFCKYENLIDFDRAMQYYFQFQGSRMVFCIENSNLQNANFDKSGSRAVIQRKGRNVGTNQAVSQLAVWSAVSLVGVDRVFEVSPVEKGAKWTPVQFQAVMKQEGLNYDLKSTNQDQRDALKLALIAKARYKWNSKR